MTDVARDIAQAGRRERILACEEADLRSRLARHLADDTDLPEAVCRDVLRTSPADLARYDDIRAFYGTRSPTYLNQRSL